jgi:hypothetical protein
MKLLVGNTGLIGTTLKDSIKFDLEYNSKNIHEINHPPLDEDNTLYLSCLPATKWLINQNPSADFDNIMDIIKTLEQREYKNIVLYSTIDVYNNAPLGSNEDYKPTFSSFDYGSNRYLFEVLVQTRLKFKKLLILRLPALFGRHIKKNILYDLINNNEIQSIKYNSKYQWYNLNNLVSDTEKNLNNLINTPEENKVSCINMFTEPLETSNILKLFNVEKSQVDTVSPLIEYNFKTKLSNTGYIDTKQNVLKSIKEFIYNQYNRTNLKIAVCIFGEERNLLSRIEDWKAFNSKFNIDFFVGLYNNDNIFDSLKVIKENLPLKSSFITENDLEEFDKIKFKSKHPIYIYGLDPKASFKRITSQLYIRQKTIELANPEKYDLIILSRSDNSKFNISDEDIYNCVIQKDLIVVNSGSHIHPGGGGGCTKCTVNTKCNLEFHANDICDYWCMGSPKAMKPWFNIYDNALDYYYNIQKQQLNYPEGVKYVEKSEENEVIININISQTSLIENQIHCYYPEKIIRSAFKDIKIIDATHTTKLWE